MARSRPSFLKLRKIIGPPALRPWFLIYWFLIKEEGGCTPQHECSKASEAVSSSSKAKKEDDESDDDEVPVSPCSSHEHDLTRAALHCHDLTGI